jgi:hypothetical protein
MNADRGIGFLSLYMKSYIKPISNFYSTSTNENQHISAVFTSAGCNFFMNKAEKVPSLPKTATTTIRFCGCSDALSLLGIASALLCGRKKDTQIIGYIINAHRGEANLFSRDFADMQRQPPEERSLRHGANRVRAPRHSNVVQRRLISTPEQKPGLHFCNLGVSLVLRMLGVLVSITVFKNTPAGSLFICADS